jgi:hypothetical protein
MKPENESPVKKDGGIFTMTVADLRGLIREAILRSQQGLNGELTASDRC